MKNKPSLVISNDIFFSEVQRFIDEGKSVIFTIKGNSMLPFLKNGQKVILEPIENTDVRRGSVVLAKSDFGIVLHRIAKMNSGFVWLAGDGNLCQHEKTSKENIIGIVKYVFVGEEKLDIQTWKTHFLALIWYLLRPFRILVKKIKKFIK